MKNEKEQSVRMKPLSGNDQLSKFVLKGFKSIAECNLELGALNILIGPNGAGKSNFQDWLQEYSLGELWKKNIFGGRPSNITPVSRLPEAPSRKPYCAGDRIGLYSQRVQPF